MKKIWAWLLVVAGLVICLSLAAGCSDDDNPVDPVTDIELPPVVVELADEFSTLYEDMNSGRMAEILHEDAKVFLLPSTIEEWEGGDHPLDFQYFDRDSLLAVHENIFSGKSGVDQTGSAIPPVGSIRGGVFERVGSWELNEEEAENFPDLVVYSALHNVLIHFNNPDYHRYEISNDVFLFATEVDEPGLSGWQLLGWREMDPFFAQATENTAWGDLLTMYR